MIFSISDVKSPIALQTTYDGLSGKTRRRV